MVTVGLSYYCYKLKSENRVEPSELVKTDLSLLRILIFSPEDEPERSNGAVVKNVVSAPTVDNAWLAVFIGQNIYICNFIFHF